MASPQNHVTAHFPYSVLIINFKNGQLNTPQLVDLISCTSHLLTITPQSEQTKRLDKDMFQIKVASTDDARLLIATAPSWLHNNYPTAKVILETFDVIFKCYNPEICHQITSDSDCLASRLLAENPSALVSPSVLDRVTVMPDESVIRLHLSHCSAADSLLARGVWLFGEIFGCQPYDDLNRGVFWCQRCIRTPHQGYTCPARRPCCRYCAANHDSRSCKVRDRENFVPRCSICDEDHVAWSLECPAIWKHAGRTRYQTVRTKISLKRSLTDADWSIIKRFRSSATDPTSNLLKNSSSKTSSPLLAALPSSFSFSSCSSSSASSSTLAVTSKPVRRLSFNFDPHSPTPSSSYSFDQIYQPTNSESTISAFSPPVLNLPSEPASVSSSRTTLPSQPALIPEMYEYLDLPSTPTPIRSNHIATNTGVSPYAGLGLGLDLELGLDYERFTDVSWNH